MCLIQVFVAVLDDKMLMALKCKGKENYGEELAGEEMKNEEDEQLMKLARQIIMDVGTL